MGFNIDNQNFKNYSYLAVKNLHNEFNFKKQYQLILAFLAFILIPTATSILSVISGCFSLSIVNDSLNTSNGTPSSSSLPSSSS
jgi:hypothetical protein